MLSTLSININEFCNSISTPSQHNQTSMLVIIRNNKNKMLQFTIYHFIIYFLSSSSPTPSQHNQKSMLVTIHFDEPIKFSELLQKHSVVYLFNK